jgi:hypothetical protein
MQKKRDNRFWGRWDAKELGEHEKQIAKDKEREKDDKIRDGQAKGMGWVG